MHSCYATLSFDFNSQPDRVALSTTGERDMKIKTMVVRNGFPHKTDTVGCTGFRVLQVTDSVEYEAGTILTKDQVEKLCNSELWKITIKPFND